MYTYQFYNYLLLNSHVGKLIKVDTHRPV